MSRPSHPTPPQTNGIQPGLASTSVTIGVFDSGVGGLSVLPALRQQLPQANLIYFADNAYTPYGERESAWLEARSLEVAEFLKTRGADALVMACNTATAAAVPSLRQRHPEWPIVGIEPGVKPAVEQSISKRIGVMATAATLRSSRYDRLLQEHGQGAQIHAQACTGLAMAIERGNVPLIESLVLQHTRPLRSAHVDTLVLGCTHYPFARAWIQAAMGPDVLIIDTAQAVAKRVASLAQPMMDTTTDSSGSCEFWTSGEPEHLRAFALRWLQWTINVGQALQPATPPTTVA